MATFVKESFTLSALNDIHRTQISSGWSPVDIASGVCVLPWTDQAGFMSYRGQIKRGLCLTAERSSGVCVLPWTYQSGFVSYRGQIKRGFSLTTDISNGLESLPRTDQAGYQSYHGHIKLGFQSYHGLISLTVERSSGSWVLLLSDEAGFESYRGKIKRGLSLTVKRWSGFLLFLVGSVSCANWKCHIKAASTSNVVVQRKVGGRVLSTEHDDYMESSSAVDQSPNQPRYS